MSDWDGKERRQNQSDHDILIRIDANLKTHLSKCDEKCRENEKHFDKHSKRIGTLEKAYWVGIGAIAVIQIILKFL